MRLELLCICTAVAANIVHERRSLHSLVGWSQRVEAGSVVRFNIGLKQRNLENADQYLLNISDPRSPHYGKLWDSEQVAKTFAPHQESVDLVREWLVLEGINDIHEAKGWLSFVTSLSNVESLLNTEYHEHHNLETGEVRIGCDQYSLPERISKHVDYISPGITLSVPLEKREITQSPTLIARRRALDLQNPRDQTDSRRDKALKRASNATDQLENCGSTMTPACIRALYNIPSPVEVASGYSSKPQNSLGIFEMYGLYNQTDLDTWFSRYAPEIAKGTHPIPAPINDAKINGQAPHTNDEAELDLMEAYGIIYPQKITLYQTKLRPRQVNGRTIQGSFVGRSLLINTLFQDLLDALDGSFCTEQADNHNESCGIYAATKVISISYGSVEITESRSSVHRLCNEFMKLALQGTTFTIGSGDYGVGVFPGAVGSHVENGCIVRGDYNASIANYPKNKGAKNGTIFNSQFPASCPYVLAVGATMLPQNETVSEPETAMLIPKLSNPALDISTSSGGGFSNWFSRPTYQMEAIDSYFSNHDPGYPFYTLQQNESFDDIGKNGGIYNHAGRGIPDVSANGVRFPIILDGDLQHVWGTSCAAPIWGSIITLINEKRSQAGKGPVGFVNPTLYQHPEVFNDITTGSNYGCFTKGFSAVEGWDPITGLGTPNFPKLLDLFMSLP